MDNSIAVYQYLTFSLGRESYAVKVQNIREVLEVVTITAIPGMPPFMRGVLNLRGRVVPVINIRKKFGMEMVDDTVKTSIIITEIKGNGDTLLVGVLVDEVHEVMDIMPDQIEPPPAMGTNSQTAFIEGMCEHGDTFLILLDIGNILTSKELVQIPRTDELNVKERGEG